MAITDTRNTMAVLNGSEDVALLTRGGAAQSLDPTDVSNLNQGRTKNME